MFNTQYYAWLVPYIEGTLDAERTVLVEAKLRSDTAYAEEARRQRDTAARLHDVAQSESVDAHPSVWPTLEKLLQTQAPVSRRHLNWYPIGLAGGLAAAAGIGSVYISGTHTPVVGSHSTPVRTAARKLPNNSSYYDSHQSQRPVENQRVAMSDVKPTATDGSINPIATTGDGGLSSPFASSLDPIRTQSLQHVSTQDQLYNAGARQGPDRALTAGGRGAAAYDGHSGTAKFGNSRLRPGYAGPIYNGPLLANGKIALPAATYTVNLKNTQVNGANSLLSFNNNAVQSSAIRHGQAPSVGLRTSSSAGGEAVANAASPAANPDKNVFANSKILDTSNVNTDAPRQSGGLGGRSASDNDHQATVSQLGAVSTYSVTSTNGARGSGALALRSNLANNPSRLNAAAAVEMPLDPKVAGNAPAVAVSPASDSSQVAKVLRWEFEGKQLAHEHRSDKSGNAKQGHGTAKRSHRPHVSLLLSRLRRIASSPTARYKDYVSLAEAEADAGHLTLAAEALKNARACRHH